MSSIAFPLSGVDFQSKQIAVEDPDQYLYMWKDLWSNRDTAWHLENTHPALDRYYPLLCSQGDRKNVLLPLCGKSNDLKYFYQQGHHVLGVECADEAIADFFHNNQLPHDVSPIVGAIGSKMTQLHSTPDQMLNVIQNNFFTVDCPKFNGTIDCVWDRGAFGTITEHEQMLYIQTIRRLLSPDFKYLLLVLEFEQDQFDGVPFSQPEEKIHRFYGDFCDIEKLESRTPNHVGLYQKHMEKPLTVKETVYLMTPKKKL